jgi:hypothetical protein
MRRFFALALLALVGVALVAAPAVACDQQTTYNGS